MVASALFASPAWAAKSASRVAKSYRVPASYPGPSCDDPAVLGQIKAEYSGSHWVPGTELFNVGDANWDSWPQDLIPRRFCKGQIRAPRRYESLIYPIYYAIIVDGPTYQVPWCVVGLDRPWYNDPRCRLARP